MNKEYLRKSREFEASYLPTIDRSKLPKFHVTGELGWINDPNGFCLYQGEYHLFFQYYPYDIKWGDMHWGHVKTKDFIHWERLPIALAPDQVYDKDGCFSGSSIELPDGRHLRVYTGVCNERKRNGVVQSYQTQCLAVGDGVDYQKYELNPVISATDLPEGGSSMDFRDPKIWKENDHYYMVVGNRSADDSGQILLFESEDAFHWNFSSIVASCHNQFGKMWECPDLFALNGKDVLLISAQEMQSIGLEFHPGNSNLCLIGTFDREAKHLMRENIQAVDYGTDFYAPQTVATPDGRRVMIAWMQSWESSGCKLNDLPFFGQMTLPRELSVVGGRLVQNPVREIEDCRSTKVSYQNVMIGEETNLQGVKGRSIDMTLWIRPVNDKNMYRHFKINVAKDGECVTTIRVKPENNTIRVDRSRSGFPYDIVNIRDFPVRLRGGEMKLRLIMDKYSLELFVNDGEQAASFVLYTPENAASISFSCDGSALLDVEKYDLKV